MRNIYKAKPDLGGFCFSAYVGSQKKDEDSPREYSIWFEILNQFSWDKTKKQGSFGKNRNDEKKHFKIKFTLVEAAEIINCIKSNSELNKGKGFFHRLPSSNKITTIKGKKYAFSGETGYSFGAYKSVDKEQHGKVGFWFNSHESLLLCLWLEWAIKKVFSEEDKERIKQFKKYQRESEKKEDDFDPIEEKVESEPAKEIKKSIPPDEIDLPF